MKKRGEPGRVRWRLSELLLAKGITASPYDLWVQEGACRHRTWDLARWGTDDAKFVNDTAPDGTKWASKITLFSWPRMKDCVKFGIQIGKEDEFGTWWRVNVEHVGSGL